MIAVQLDMLAPAPAVPYQRKSATSRAAADRVRPHARNHEQDVYDTIVAAEREAIENLAHSFIGRGCTCDGSGTVNPECRSIVYNKACEEIIAAIRARGRGEGANG